jgi:DNA topoisomerase-2
MDGDLVVNRKKKQVVVEELRSRKYEAFPRMAANKKTKSDEDDAPEEEEDAEVETDTGTRDYDYLLSVRFPLSART